MQAMFTLQDDLYVPSDPARGVWSEDSLHGRAVVGLVGHVLVKRYGKAGMLPARLTIDMPRLSRFAPIRIESRLLRDGGRLHLAEAVLTIEGEEYARATCQFLRQGESPQVPRWSGEAWDAAHPDSLETLPINHRGTPFEWRNASGGLGSRLPRHMWMREKFLLVDGEPLSGWDRVALAADFASPWAHAARGDPGYINTDVTLQIYREPEGEWIGFEATGHQASHGIAVGNCRIHDVSGPLGFVATTAIAHRPLRE
jgi:hypothetical protein